MYGSSSAVRTVQEAPSARSAEFVKRARLLQLDLTLLLYPRSECIQVRDRKKIYRRKTIAVPMISYEYLDSSSLTGYSSRCTHTYCCEVQCYTYDIIRVS